MITGIGTFLIVIPIVFNHVNINSKHEMDNPIAQPESMHIHSINLRPESNGLGSKVWLNSCLDMYQLSMKARCLY